MRYTNGRVYFYLTLGKEYIHRCVLMRVESLKDTVQVTMNFTVVLNQSINQSINLFAQKHDRVKVKTKQSEQESKDTDATNSCPPVD